jgi:hypothetical protein
LQPTAACPIESKFFSFIPSEICTPDKIPNFFLVASKPKIAGEVGDTINFQGAVTLQTVRSV